MKKLICAILVLSLVGAASAWIETESPEHANSTGLWSAAATWGPCSIPDGSEEARIGEGLTVTIDANLVNAGAIHLGNLGVTEAPPASPSHWDPSKGTLVIDGCTASSGYISIGHRNDSSGQLDVINNGTLNVTGNVYFSQDGTGTTSSTALSKMVAL